MNPEIKVLYTRTSDDISWSENEEDDLKERVELAKKEKADYFISIHINSNEDSSVYGYYSNVRANDSISMEIASKISENLFESGWKEDLGTRTTEYEALYVVDYLEIPSILFEVYASSDFSHLYSCSLLLLSLKSLLNFFFLLDIFDNNEYIECF